MIEKFDAIERVPASVYNLDIKDSDTIVLQVDQEKFSFDEAQQLYNMTKENFPKNNLLMTFDGFEIKGVVHNG